MIYLHNQMYKDKLMIRLLVLLLSVMMFLTLSLVVVSNANEDEPEQERRALGSVVEDEDEDLEDINEAETRDVGDETDQVDEDEDADAIGGDILDDTDVNIDGMDDIDDLDMDGLPDNMGDMDGADGIVAVVMALMVALLATVLSSIVDSGILDNGGSARIRMRVRVRSGDGEFEGFDDDGFFDDDDDGFFDDDGGNHDDDGGNHDDEGGNHDDDEQTNDNVQKVEDMIERLPDAEDLTLSNYGDYEDDIHSAREAYDELSADGKNILSDEALEKLEALEEELEYLENAQVYKDRADNLNEAIERLPDIDSISLYNAPRIEHIKSTYEELPGSAKDYVHDENVKKLEEAEVRIEELESGKASSNSTTDLTRNVRHNIDDATGSEIHAADSVEDGINQLPEIDDLNLDNVDEYQDSIKQSSRDYGNLGENERGLVSDQAVTKLIGLEEKIDELELERLS